MEDYSGFLNRKQINPSLSNKRYIEKNIFVIDNFITEEEQLGILNSSWINWKPEIKSRISALFNDEFNVYGQGMVRKLLVDDFTEAHSDQHDKVCGCGYCLDNPDSYFMYGTVLYLSDNFTGGKIRYTKKDIEYAPMARSLVCHPASLEYEHEVLKVESGSREFVSFFLEQKHAQR